MNMKHLTLTLAVAAAATLALNAAEPLLSPRSQENKIKTVPGVTADLLVRGLQPGSPKGRDMAMKYAAATYVAGGRTERNLITENRNIAASPRALETFPALTASGTFNVAPVVTLATPKK